MTKERCMELLGTVINHVSCANNTNKTLKELFYMGFDPKELVEEFNFGQDDVDDAWRKWNDDDEREENDDE